MSKHHVYHLVDPNTSLVRYVGKSTNPRSRLRTHMQESRAAQNTEKKRWIASLIATGQSPVLVIVASFATEPDARARESTECHAFRASILNIHDPARGAADFHRQAQTTT